MRLAATNALLNSLEFTKANFEKDVSHKFVFKASPDLGNSDIFNHTLNCATFNDKIYLDNESIFM